MGEVKSRVPEMHRVYVEFLERRGLYNKKLYPGPKNGKIFKDILAAGGTPELLAIALERMAADKWMGKSEQLTNAGLIRSRWTALIQPVENKFQSSDAEFSRLREEQVS